MRSVWLLNPTTPSAGAGAAPQVPTQCVSFGKTALQSSALWCNPAAAAASTATDFVQPWREERMRQVIDLECVLPPDENGVARQYFGAAGHRIGEGDPELLPPLA